MFFPEFVLVFISIISFSINHVNGNYKFPNNFSFGVGTSAYQVEGAYAIADKGESILDRITKRDSEFFRGSRGDVSADSYHFYKRDIEMVQELGVDIYHFSISWSRLLPTGFSNSISRDGLKYYHGLIDGLLAKNITPHVTLYHWDLPQKLQDLGGWSNSLMVDYFVDYAKVTFGEFGKKVKTWVTFNDVSVICNSGKRKFLPQYLPHEGISGVTDYLCSKHVLLAHARAWMTYRMLYKPEQNGKVGISFAAQWVEPLSNSTRDMEIADLAMQFLFDRFAFPIFSKVGDYPIGFKNAVANRSATQGYAYSRLTPITEPELIMLKGSSDFMVISILDQSLLAFKESIGNPHYPEPSVDDDLGFVPVNSDELEIIKKSYVDYSSIVYKILMRIKEKYNNTEVKITGNGLGTSAGLIDLSRVFFIQNNLLQVGRALKDGCNITSYSYWTLMDGFQWMDGYRVRTGLYEVDFKSPKKIRTPRISSLVYRNIVMTRMVDPLYTPNIPKFFHSSSNSIYSVKNVYTMLSLLILCLVMFI